MPTWVPAIKVNPNSCGRGSGGLLTLVAKKLRFEVLDACQHWTFLKIFLESMSVFICSFYIHKSLDPSQILDRLQALLANLDGNYDDPVIIFGGDFNCRVANLGSCEEDLTSGTPFYRDRVSPDVVRPSLSGIVLIDFMTENGFVLLNGRSPHDRPAQFTFIHCSQGKSVIDLIFVKATSLSLIDDFFVDTQIASSDHFPLVIHLADPATLRSADTSFARDTTPRLRWREADREVYIRFLEESSSLPSSPAELIELTENIDGMYNNLCSAFRGAARSAGIEQSPRIPGSNSGLNCLERRRWFDGNCARAKREVRVALREARRANFDEPRLGDYLIAKSKYTGEKERRRALFESDIRERLANVRSAGDFWSAVKLKRLSAFSPGLPISIWNEFYCHMYPPRLQDNLSFLDFRNPWLDDVITVEELDRALARCKAGKAPGTDQLSGEFIRAMPQEWRAYTLQLFNKCLEKEYTPLAWSEVLMTMILKKGDKLDPSNYRGIALVNCFAKLFTSILCKRLYGWAESVGILPEPQAGFRKERSCQDNIFSANGLIQLQLRLSGRVVYGLFVDFRRAFDSVPHALLWNKLHRLGVSAKFIKTVKSLYDSASFKVKCSDGLSDSFSITEGVLQGELLSPLLFILYLHDIDSFFRDRGITGLNIDGYNDILSLLYADDLILFADTPAALKRILKVLLEYCSYNKLSVNTGKTKIVVFRNGGCVRGAVRIRDSDGQQSMSAGFFYGNQIIDVVSDYTYLGVVMASSSLGLRAALNAMDKARRASGVIISILASASADSWSTVLKLYQSMMIPTALYAAPVWALRYCDLIESVQVGFFKKILLLPRNSPNAMVRLEVGVLKLTFLVCKLTLN